MWITNNVIQNDYQDVRRLRIVRVRVKMIITMTMRKKMTWGMIQADSIQGNTLSQVFILVNAPSGTDRNHGCWIFLFLSPKIFPSQTTALQQSVICGLKLP